MKKVRCDYEIWKRSDEYHEGTLQTDYFAINLRSVYKTKASALRALKRLATKLNIELGREIT